MRIRLRRVSASLIIVCACGVDSRSPASRSVASTDDRSAADVWVVRDQDGQRVQTLDAGGIHAQLSERPAGAIVRLTQTPTFVTRANLARSGAPAAQLEAAARSQRATAEKQHARIRAVLEKQLGGRLTARSRRPVVGAVELEEFHDVLNALVLRGIGVEAVRKALDGNADVASIEPVVPVRASLLDSVPLIHADATWGNLDANGLSDNGAGIRIGIVDTGIDYTSADLGGCFGPGCKVAGGYDFVNQDPDPMDDHGHGTHVASIAAGNGTYGSSGAAIPGIAPGARLYAYKVLDANGGGDSGTIISAIQRCADPNGDGNPADHLDVCNLSLGGYGNPDDAMSLAIDNATAAGVLFAVAAGNSGPGAQTIQSPGTARTAVTVAAACKPADIGVNAYCASAVASFSSRGPVVWPVNGVNQTLDKPDVSAPGVNICATEWVTYASQSRCLDSRHIAISGTSMAAPEVAGVAALLRQQHPELAPAQIKALIVSGATGLNLDHTIQGSGRVDALASLALAGVPGSVARITGLPAVDLDAPATRLASFSSDVAVTNTTGQTLTYDAGVARADAGLTIAVSPASITLDPGQTGTFTVTRQVDHAVAPSGTEATGTVVFSTPAGSATGTISVGVRDRLLLAPAVADLGVDLASQSTWTATFPVQLTNQIGDLAATYSATVTCCTDFFQRGPPYVSAALDSSSISLAPGGTATVNLTVTANNSPLANGAYSGTLQLTSPVQTKTIPIKFFKGYGLQIQTGGQLPAVIAISSATSPSSSFAPSQSSTLRYLLNPGPYSVEAVWWGPSPVRSTHVVQPGVATDQPVRTVALDPSQATSTITLRPTDHTGAPAAASTMIYRLTDRASAGGAIVMLSTNFSAGLQFRVSPVSSDYSFTAAAVSKAAGEIDSWLYELPDGIPGNVTVTNIAADFVTRDALSFRRASGTNTPWLLPYGCLISPYYQQISIAGGGSWCFGNLNFSVPLPVGVAAPVHFFNSASRDLRSTAYADPPSFSPWIIDGSPSGQTLFIGANYYATRDHVFSWPTFVPWGDFGYPLTPAQWFQVAQCAEPPSGPYLPFASAPLRDALRWENHRADFTRVQGERGQTYSHLWGCSQDWYATTVNASYQLFVNGAFVYGEPIRGSAIYPPRVEGQHRWVLTAHPVIGGVQTQVETVSTFNVTSSSLVDENPPALRELHLVSGGQWQEVFDPSEENHLQFEVDPVPGLADQDASFRYPLMSDGIASVAAWSSTDGAAWTPVSVFTTADGSFLSDVLPVVAGASLYWFRVYATDLAGNTLTYTFQVPTGAGYFVDTTSPIASIDSPADGDTLVPGDVTVTASASDDVGVVEVDLLVDGALAGTAASSPARFTWNARAGVHTLQARALDAARNAGVSSLITVTVLDQTPPTVSLTAPASGSLQRGSVAMAASASDDVAVSRVEFLVDGVRIATASAAPWTASWDSTAVADGPHGIATSAYDAAGNSSVSPVVTITTDNTPPAVAVAAPAAGALVSGNVALGATVSDASGISRVDYYLDGSVLIASSTASPFSAAWSSATAADGVHSLSARASDLAGNSASSPAIAITVDNSLPQVTLTSPAAGSVIVANTTLSATASDVSGISRVDFYLDGATVVASVASTPYMATWNSSSTVEGAHSISATAVDRAGNSASSAPVNIQVDRTGPAIVVTSPANGGTVPAGTTVTITASASDPSGVANVQFFVNGALKCTVTSAPYTCAWALPKTKRVTYSLTAKGVDVANNAATSAAVTVTSR